MPGSNGHPVSLGDFRGTEVLLLFWNPGCGFCREILDELKDWDAALPHDGPTLLVISTGDDDENRALRLRSPVLRDEGFTLGPTFGVHGTPMAVQVAADGTITSDVTSGAPDIRTLLRSHLRSNQAPAKPISPAHRKAATTSSINGHSTRHHGRWRVADSVCQRRVRRHTLTAIPADKETAVTNIGSTPASMAMNTRTPPATDKMTRSGFHHRGSLHEFISRVKIFSAFITDGDIHVADIDHEEDIPYGPA
ncbi:MULTISPECIES: TlpA disulfide reductase family protein [unclassified Frankia]|uniref:peroxiredoxin family protein n=1 Tax=unclassified Frankia TaxID=2632575 RepID=UPI002AD2EDAD|nr:MULTISPECIES: TlpA disulfide reductase family protein [unclassified Frankia]